MRVVAIIPARWSSARFPGKILAPVLGRPVIDWVVRRVSEASGIDAVVVATDDERIAEAAESAGARAVMTRLDHQSGTDRCAEALQSMDADAVVNVQGDEPLVSPSVVEKLAEEIRNEGEWDMVTAATPITETADVRSMSVVKVVFDRAGRALYFSRSPIPCVRDPEESAETGPIHFRHIGIYAYGRAFLEKLALEPPCPNEKAEKLEQLRALHMGGRILVIQTSEQGSGVDVPEDIGRVEKILKEEECRKQ